MKPRAHFPLAHVFESFNDKLSFLIQCVTIEEKASSFDFGQITFHDFNSWREKQKSQQQQVIYFQSVNDLQHSDMLAYFDNL